MFDEIKLWKDRGNRRLRDLGKYLRYIFNGHLVIVLVFLIGSAAFYYQKWIATLSSSFPAEIIMAVILAIFLTYSPVYNFLVEADQVFLIPLEVRLKGYFLRSGIVGLIFQGYIQIIVLAVLMPLYAHTGRGYGGFFPFLIALLVVKVWNIAANWRILYLLQPSVYFTDMVVRYCVNVLFTYLLFKQANLYILFLLLIIMVFYYRSFFVRTKAMGLKWNVLIAGEEKRMSSFYRLANLFTDVPKLKETVRRRKWLDFLVNGIGFSQEKTFLYLFSRTFLRSSDYLGLFVRLTIIGALALYFLSFGWGQIVISLLFLYLTGFQLLPLWNHHQSKLWVDLYPVSGKFKSAAFHFLLMVILTTQAVIFFLIVLLKGGMMNSVYTLASGILFNLIFVYFYSQNRLKS